MQVGDLPAEAWQLVGQGGGEIDKAALASDESAEMERLKQMLTCEQTLWQSGAELVAGLDEVGRGPIAGPVVTAAVIWRPGCWLAGIDDSKKLSAKKRYALEPLIKQAALAWAVAAVGVWEIDRYNILQATKLAMLRALYKLPLKPQHLLLDALRLADMKLPSAALWQNLREYAQLPQTALIKGDAKSMSIAAASILAKCHRDRMMQIYDEKYPGYNLAQHAGYPTIEHKRAVFALGRSPIHRRSFVLRPIKGE